MFLISEINGIGDKGEVYLRVKKRKYISDHTTKRLHSYDSYFKRHLGANVETTCGKKGIIHRDQKENNKYWVYPYRTGEFEPGLYYYTIINYYS